MKKLESRCLLSILRRHSFSSARVEIGNSATAAHPVARSGTHELESSNTRVLLPAVSRLLFKHLVFSASRKSRATDADPYDFGKASSICSMRQTLRKFTGLHQKLTCAQARLPWIAQLYKPCHVPQTLNQPRMDNPPDQKTLPDP